MSQPNSLLSFLSFDRFWSTDGSVRQKSACAIFVTLFIFLGILAIFIYQLINVFTYKSVDSSQQITYSIEPPMTYLNTINSASGQSQYMVALSVLQSGCAVNSSIALQGFYAIKTSASTTATQVPIYLETCTDQHFAKLPGKLSKLSQWTLNSLLCLPLNQNYNLGGSTAISGVERYLTFRFTCPSTCGTTTNCGTVEFFTQNTQVNSHSEDELYRYYMDRRSLIVSNPTTYENIYEIDESTINADNNLVFSKETLTTTLSGGKFHTDVPTTNATTTTLNFKRSDKTIHHQRDFLKLFDVFAYIGGLIQLVFVLFFFMPSFGRFLNDMRVAQAVFRTKQETQGVNFFSFLKQSVFTFIASICSRPDWDSESKRDQYKRSVSKMTDVVLLQKRIIFLEEAITILLEQHHLKGLHLVHNLNQEQFEKNSKQHNLRDRLVFYLSKYGKNAKKDKGKTPKQGSLKLKEEQILKGSSSSDMDRPAMDKKGSTGQLGSSGNMMKSSELADSKVKGSKGIRHQADVSDELSVVEEESEDFAMRQDKIEMQKELEFIGQLTDADLDEAELTEQVQNDLLRLLEEAEDHRGDLRSKKICEKLEGWLKKGLENAARKYKKEQRRKGKMMREKE